MGRNLLKVTVFCDVADWSDDSCIIGVDQSFILLKTEATDLSERR
jgi:hypothetical protein